MNKKKQDKHNNNFDKLKWLGAVLVFVSVVIPLGNAKYYLFLIGLISAIVGWLGKRETPEEKYIKICPKCHSTDWKMADPTKGTIGSVTQLQLVNNVYSCRECGYQGFFVDVKESEIEGIKRKLKKKK